jgi:hypothetical protein
MDSQYHGAQEDLRDQTAADETMDQTKAASTKNRHLMFFIREPE